MEFLSSPPAPETEIGRKVANSGRMKHAIARVTQTQQERIVHRLEVLLIGIDGHRVPLKRIIAGCGDHRGIEPETRYADKVPIREL
jgi:hypothetical protein